MRWLIQCHQGARAVPHQNYGEKRDPKSHLYQQILHSVVLHSLVFGCMIFNNLNVIVELPENNRKKINFQHLRKFFVTIVKKVSERCMKLRIWIAHSMGVASVPLDGSCPDAECIEKEFDGLRQELTKRVLKQRST